MQEIVEKKKQPGNDGERGAFSPTLNGMGAVLFFVMSFVAWGLRGMAGVSCLFGWACVAFSSYWAVTHLGSLFIYLKLDSDTVLWGGIAGGFLLQLVCYVCFRCSAGILRNSVLFLTKKGNRVIRTVDGSLSCIIKGICGFALLAWPLLVALWTYRLDREMAFSSGRLFGMIEDCLKVWSLPVYVLFILGVNYLFLDLLFVRVLGKRKCGF